MPRGQAGAQGPHRQGHDRREGEKPDHGIEIDPERKLGPAYRADHGLGPVDEFGHATVVGDGLVTSDDLPDVGLAIANCPEQAIFLDEED